MKKINKKLIIPIIIAFATYFLSYQIPKFTVDIKRLAILEISLDKSIPFVHSFIYIYIGAFIQWIYFFHVLLKNNTKTGYKFCSAIIIGSLIGFVIFLIYPTGINRPEVIGDTITDNFLRLVYSMDSIICAFPSFHCFLSTICIPILIECKASKKTIIINVIYSILVFASTLLVKQHTFVDVPAGIALAFISIWLCKYIRFDNIFEIINKTFNLNDEEKQN